jgi:formylglycine-generating enzyme required for sulfatase activity
LVERLWNVLAKTQHDPERRLRAACVLATYDPAGDAKGERWQTAAPFVTDQLLAGVQSNPSHYLPLLEALRPVRERLFGPLAEAYRNRERPESERSFAITILADYASDQAGILAELLLDADAKSFAVLYPKVVAQRERALALFQKTIHIALASQKAEEARERLAKRQANASVALLRMDRAAEVWPLLGHSPDPRVRSYLIHRLSPMGADARTVVQRLEEEPDVTIRRALLLSLGEFGEKEFPLGERALAVEKLREVYRTAADPGLHGAAEWLLRHWKQDRWLKQIDEEWAKDKQQREWRLERIGKEWAKAAKPQWYVNGQGQTMVVIPGPVVFQMGSPATEAGRSANETWHLQRIGRTFALAAKPVTVEQFRRFRKDHDYLSEVAPTEDCPVHFTTWFDAAEYCNWLSAHEGIGQDQWCYAPNAQGHYAQGMKLRPNYLHVTGYRLPTEAEWEYACRAGAVTSRYYGESEELLGKYGWYVGNAGGRSRPVGSLKPNDFGFFDMHGNIWSWCQERYKAYAQGEDGKALEDNEDIQDVNNESRASRIGAFNSLPSFVRSASRSGDGPNTNYHNLGFRPARTFR